MEEAQRLRAGVAHRNGQTKFAAPKTAATAGSITFLFDVGHKPHTRYICASMAPDAEALVITLVVCAEPELEKQQGMLKPG